MRGMIRSVLAAAGIAITSYAHAPASLPPAIVMAAPEPVPEEPAYREIVAYVTGYNTVEKQTDRNPCIGAMGTNICGRRNVIACPRPMALGTIVEIKGKAYVCEDRTAMKYNSRFDINCDKDKSCPFQVAGWTTVKVFDE
jgi:hypothetical protein